MRIFYFVILSLIVMPGSQCLRAHPFQQTSLYPANEELLLEWTQLPAADPQTTVLLAKLNQLVVTHYAHQLVMAVLRQKKST